MNRNIYFISSDWHLAPQEDFYRGISDFVYHSLNLTSWGNKTIVILNGDILDLIVWGWKDYKTAARKIDQLFTGIPVIYIVGNHEGRIDWVKKLFAPYKKHIKVRSSLNLKINGKRWHIEHGEHYSVDWGKIGFLYSIVAFTGLKIWPKGWLRFSKFVGWVPTKYLNEKGETEKYNHGIGSVWGNALKNTKYNVLVGHTHLACWLESGNRQLLDAGNARDMTYCVIYPDGKGVRI